MRILWISNFTSSQPLEDRMYIQLCAEELKKQGVEMVFCHSSPITIYYGEKHFATTWRGFRCVYPVRKLIPAIRAMQPNVVLLNSFDASLMGELGDINREYPTVALPTSQLFSLIPDAVQFLLSVDHVITRSENAKHVLEALGCEDVSVIPPSIGSRSVTECTDPTVVTLSPMTPIKNHLTILEAVSLARRRLPDVELAVVGSGPLKPMYEKLIDLLNLGTQVKIIDQVSLTRLFREVRVMALPSFCENAPMSILEAYARGVPCIVSKSSWGNMFKAALKASPDDPKEWADHLVNLLTDWNLYIEVQNRQLEEVKERFSPRNIQGYIPVFEKLNELNKYKIKKISKRVEA